MSQEFNITVLPGDGIGPEVIREAIKILKIIESKKNLKLNLTEAPVGGAGYEATGHPLPEETLKAASSADAVLLGAVGGPKWETIDFSLRPERALLGLRSNLGLFANLRPAKIFAPLSEASTLKPEVVEGLDIMVVRELTGGIYFGEPRGIETLPDGTRKGVNTLVYTEAEIERIAKVAFDVAGKRNKNVLFHRQGQRAGMHRPVAGSGHQSSCRLSRHHAFAHVCRQLRHAAGAEPETVRRHRDHQYVRGYPERPGVDADRVDRHAALGQSGRWQSGDVRTDSRQCAGYRGTGHREPAGDDFVGRNDVQVFL